MNGNLLRIENLKIEVEGKEILKGINLSINKGEIHALMGPNGTGKSTLAFTLMGHPRYEIKEGSIFYLNEDLTKLNTSQRAKKGIFMAFQYPEEIPGVSLESFLRNTYNSKNGKEISFLEFRKILKEKMKFLEMDDVFLKRYVNEGFSGGEKKRNEILQMAVFEPTLAILDETDSGLDIDSLKIVSMGINKLMNPELGILIITHYQRILNFIKPDFVHILMDGKIVKSGREELSKMLEEKGYDWVRKELNSQRL
ncbi:MAG: Fe-S cluster assembly ATPase SufC [Acidobacteriota bacterium]